MARFKIVETPSRKENEKPTYHVRYAPYRTISIEKLMSQINYGTTYTEADVDGLLSLIQNLIVEQLKHGNNLRVDGIGTFTLSLKCSEQHNKKKIGSHNVELRNVKFKPAGELMKKLRDAKFYIHTPLDTPKYTFEKRKQILLVYLSENYHITAKEYRLRTYLSKTAAANDLKQFVEEKLIIRQGRGPTTFYRLSVKE